MLHMDTGGPFSKTVSGTSSVAFPLAFFWGFNSYFHSNVCKIQSTSKHRYICKCGYMYTFCRVQTPNLENEGVVEAKKYENEGAVGAQKWE
jgi:hypothetical protein